ncbi:subtilase-type protease inhibitor [Streptomyces sp. H10-C2]|uniref:subtilase-type protease inhibitor n=1 Tax=unclassified Streptomyces TaxID=2593676 RepID=UPI0024B9B87E|nr:MULTISPECIES: subtilase-type protease inhibitor [unclassified Streptomyces]MDJ0343049.1 subtilase-type protease inhibitor [Streptomyces sp. PH10-H1]MDJ0372771.1 subtilase-type protease inhibitor [Streptomyces sp. H10-C2]
MRYTLGAIGLGAALAVSCVAGTSGTARAESPQPQRLYAPSAMVLTIGRGENVSTAAVQRAVLLRCRPTPGGDHPSAQAACTELNVAGGDFAALLASDPGKICPRIWDPVVVTADGVWQGQRVSYAHTYANSCVMGGETGPVFAF